MIEKKLIKPKELSGGLCVKIVIKEIKVDSEEVENFISDLYKLDEEKNEVMYYENVAYTLAKLPVTLTEEESFQGLYGSATCSHIDMIIPVPIEDAVLINVIEKPADYALTTKDMIKAYLVYMDVPFNASASKLTLWDLIPV